MNTPTTKPARTLGKRYLKETEVSELTGLALSTIRNHRAARKGLPFIKLGKAVRYDFDAVVRYMDKNQVETNTAY